MIIYDTQIRGFPLFDYSIRLKKFSPWFLSSVIVAKKREHKVYVVMSDGQCSSDADTAKNFAKFGHGETECSAIGTNNKVYNFEMTFYMDNKVGNPCIN